MSAPASSRIFGVCADTSIALAVVALAGCASPGPPRAPSLHLPEAASAIGAERVGDEVRVHWTTPSETTDGLEMDRTITAQICRRVIAARATAQEACQPVHRAVVKPGLSEAVDVLPIALLRTTGTVLEYQVELLNPQERSSGLSSPAFAAGGPAPPRVAGLRVEAVKEGAFLRWKPEDGADLVEVERRRMGPSLKRAGSVTDGDGPVHVRLRAVRDQATAAPFTPDSGGMIDPVPQPGESFVYTAQRVRNVVLDGRALELRSAASEPFTVVMRDTFAPETPSRVEAIAGKAGGRPVVDLSWTPNTEKDLAGYLVYRKDISDPAARETELTSSQVAAPGFQDTAVQPGHIYLYTVVAVDTLGNRSAASTPAQETVPLP